MTAALHRAGGQWRAVLVRREGDASRLLETKAFPASASPAETQREIAHWLDERHPGRVVGVLPASRVICRACPLPKGTPDRLLAALQLQAEAHLLGAVPQHRLGLAVLPASTGEGGRTGLLIGWPEGTASTPSPLPPDRVASDLTWTADIAALAGLLDSLHPDQPLLALNRDDGAVALALCPPTPTSAAGGVTFRATREECASDDEWHAAVRRVVAETALGVDMPTGAIREAIAALDQRLATAPPSALLVPAAVRERVATIVAGVPQDEAWWHQFGIALGGALCASGELAPLTRLLEEPLRERPTIFARTAAALARPRTAALLVGLAVFMLAIGPLAFARLRLGLLRTKVDDLAALRASNLADNQRRAMYRELGSLSWPMAKLLGDIANCTPEGIELTSITIDRNQGVSLIGIARDFKDQLAGDRVAEMSRIMDESGLFDSITRDTKPGNIDKTKTMTIAAKVRDPFRPVDWKPTDDFAVVSLAERKYGKKVDASPKSGAGHSSEGGATTRAPEAGAAASDEGAAESGDAVAKAAPAHPSAGGRHAPTEGGANAPGRGSRSARPAAAAESAKGEGAEGGSAESGEGERSSEGSSSGDAASEPAAGGHSGPARRSAGDSSAGGAATRGGRLGAAGSAIPDPLSEAEINAMSEAELKEALVRVSNARQNPNVDPATKDRLKSEFNLILKRQREIQK